MKKFKSIAVLIDVTHTPFQFLDPALEAVSNYGRIALKRAYGNWGNTCYGNKKWKEELNRLSIKAIQQFNYTSTKNSSDIVLVIDAMTMLLTHDCYDAFAIVSSGDDFTPLSDTLSESGKFVIGVGTEEAPEAFRNSCDRFCMLKDPEEDPPEQEDSSKTVSENAADNDVSNKLASIEARLDAESVLIRQILTELKSKPSVMDISTAVQSAVSVCAPDPAVSSASASNQTKSKNAPGMDKVHQYLKEAYNKSKKSAGFVSIGEAATYLTQKIPGFSPKQYGYSKYSTMLEAFPKKYNRKGSQYKCLD